MKGLQSGKVTVVPYDSKWVEKYAREAISIRKALGGLIQDIQHVGSTSVPGMDAKPIIDIMVGLEDLSVVASLVSPLRALGYLYRGLLLGIEGHYFFRKGEPIKEYFLHVFEYGGGFWNQRIAFRERLITSPELAQEYRELKQRLAKQHPDNREAYTAGKKGFIERTVPLQ